jgi:hypothetical protein
MSNLDLLDYLFWVCFFREVRVLEFFSHRRLALLGLLTTQRSSLLKVPLSLSGLSLLEELDLEENRLSGNPYDALTAIPTLRRIRLSFNNFNGTIPTSIQVWEQVSEWWFAANAHTGIIPTELGRMRSLGTYGVVHSSHERSSWEKILPHHNVCTCPWVLSWSFPFLFSQSQCSCIRTLWLAGYQPK